MRLTPQSLQGRMALLSALAIAAALAVAGWTIAGVLERFVVAGLDQRLDAELALLASSVESDGTVDREALEQRLGAIEPGPGWRWQIAGPAGTIGSGDFPQLRQGPPHPPPGPPARPDRHRDRVEGGITALDGEDPGGDAVHARSLTIQTSRGAVSITAAAPRDIVRTPIRAALTPLLLALAVLGGLLALASFVQLRLGLRPVLRMQDQVAAMRRGERGAIDENQPAELRPLAAELNALGRDNAAALAATRLSSANLAHALKTPVSTLALALRGDPERAALVARIDATIRHHLGRARADAANLRSTAALAPTLADVIDAIRRIHASREIAFAATVDPELAVAVDAQDLGEMLGNLIDNAARHAAARVDVAARPAPDDRRLVEIAISDDGPGVAPELLSQLGRPGVRIDEQEDSHGFGLAIVAELVSAYGGALSLGPAPAGGLAATIRLPRA